MSRPSRISIASIVGLGLLLLLVAVPVGFAREPVPSYDPQGYVSDHAGVIDAEWRARIRSVCQDLERKTGVEMVVVTVPALKPYGSANDYAVGLYQKWGIGSAQNEHGVLVLLSVQERQAAVTMGRRMLPVMGGNVVGKVGHEYLDPAIKNGHFGEGLYRTVVGLASVSQDIRVSNVQKAHFRGLGFWITITTASGALWFLWWLSRPDLRHPYGRIRKGHYWGSGQGGFGGNFGGHGGGMSGEGWK
jgi:uncharacterized protein